MPIAAGTRLGPYQIEAPIGAGGMGEVYRAKDTRLDRLVAIKVLPASLAGDPEFRERFEREARSISQLTHPHICTLYDVGNQDGVNYLVMEYLEGESLAQRLRKGPLPVAQALDCALEIADALDKAHRRGIVHRDLKPGNVMLTKAGAKLLDFGLAKIGAVTAPGAVETKLLTSPAENAGNVAAPLTSQGSLLGTFQYMAPEQVEGQDADARADIWAFGCLLYEMATGQRAFEGKTRASLIASILEREPRPMAELQPMTPPALGRVVRTCLAKDPDDRFQTAHDLWLQLQWIAEGGSAAGLAAPVVAHRKSRERALWMGAALGLAAIVGAAAWWLKPAPPETHVVTRFVYPLPDGQAFSRTGRHSLAISPDGTKIVYVANQQLYVRAMEQLDAQPLRGASEDPVEPVFSPDGQWIAYFVAGSGSGGFLLRKIAVAGGAPVTLCSVASLPFGASWQHGLIAFGQYSQGRLNAIQAVVDTGGTPRTLVSLDVKEGRPVQPQLLDDGAHVLFTIIPLGAAGTEGQIVVQGLDDGRRTVLANGGTNAQILPTGQLLYIHDATLLAQPIDLKRLAVTGGPVPIVEGVFEPPVSGAGQFAVSRTGTLAYWPGRASGEQRVMVWVDRQGHEQPIAAKPRTYSYPRLSPDDTKIAVDSADEENDIWIWDLVKETPTRLTFGPGTEGYPAWMPDGRYVVFASLQSGAPGPDIFRKAADGTGALEPLTKNGTGGSPQSISQDGKFLVYRTGGPYNLMLLSLEGGNAATPLLADPKFNELNGVVSPDGRWIAYESSESSPTEVFVRPFPNVDGGRWQVSSGGGTRPLWARSGRELYFASSAPVRLMAVAIQPGAAFSFGKPEPLFDLTPYAFMGPPGRKYDVTKDGRFLMTKPVAAEVFTHQTIVVVSHWFDEVRARVK
jgi:Tol biopolymer transport system component/predicted Ser/Thr protein kinase